MSLENTPITEVVTANTSLLKSISQWASAHHELLLGYILHIIIAVVILIIGVYVTRVLTALLHRVMVKKNIDKTITDFISMMVRYALFAFFIVASLAHLGVQVASLVAVIGAASLAIGLALKGSLSDFAAGVLLVILRPFKAGNFIEAAGASGVVQQIQVFNCQLKTGDNRIITVSNSAILKGNIVNVSRKAERRIDLVVRVGYEADLKVVKQLLSDIVAENEFVLKEPVVQIAVSELTDSSVNLVVRPWVESTKYWPVRATLLENIKNEFDKANINIPYKQVTLHRK